MNIHWVLINQVTEFIGRAIRKSLAETTTRHPHRKRMRMVVAAKEGVPADPDAAVEQGHGLAWTILSADYDGLLFLKQTKSAEPVNPERIWK